MSQITRTKLPNGLTVLSEETHEAPVVALQAWVRVGSADETPEVAGVAHLHEHMLFKGTKRRGVGELARTVEASGGEINAWTSFDQTVYHVVLAANELDTGVDILGDALQFSAFDAGELSRESEVVLEEIRRAQDAPARRVSNAMMQLAYQKHPYRRPVLGYEDTVRALTRERVLEFFHHHYRPEQVTLVCVGDFRTDDLLKSVRAHFGDWRGVGPAPAPLPPRPTEAAQQLRSKVLREDVKEARLALAWHGPHMKSADLAAVDAMALILGHGDSSRLYEVVRRREPLVNDVFAYAYTPQDPGLFVAGAGLRAENLEAATSTICRACFRLREELVSSAELEKARVLLLSEAAYQRETVQGQARKLGFFEVVAGDYAFESTYLTALRALVPEDIRAAARRYLHANPTIVVQTPEDAAPVDEAALGACVTKALEDNHRRARAPVPKDAVARLELDNGAVILVRQEDSPVVALRAVALGGQRWETPTTAGLSNLFTSVWGLATESLTSSAMAERVALLGGSLSAFCGRNTEGLRAEFIRDKGNEGLDLFCDHLLRPQFVPIEMEREREVLLERVRNRDDSPAAVAFDLFASTLHPTHSYGLRLAGSEKSISAITLDDLVAHRARFLSPDKLVISVVGGIDPERTLDTLAAALEGAKGQALPASLPPDAAPTAPRRAQHQLDRKQAHVVIGAMGTTLHDQRRYGLEVLTTILSGQSGRLFLDLRDSQSLAYSISSSNLEGLDPGHILVHMGTSPDKVEQGVAGIYRHLERLCTEPVKEEELARAKRYLIGTHAIDLQRGGARAMLMALHERYDLGYDDHLRYAEYIRSVSLQDVQELAKTFLTRNRLIEVVVGPATR